MSTSAFIDTNANGDVYSEKHTIMGMQSTNEASICSEVRSRPDMNRIKGRNLDAFNDDKIPTVDSSKEKRDYGGFRFGDCQLLAYFLSCVGMMGYFCSFCYEYRNNGNFDDTIHVSNRAYFHGYLEILLLLLRTVNEVWFQKFDLGDVGHHLSMALCFYLVINVTSCIPFCWTVCHMQILHCPLFIWYLGCRQNALFETNRVVSEWCKRAFPLIWLFSVGYRASVMAASAWLALQGARFVALGVIVPVGALLLLLDARWSSYFLSLLGWPSASHSLPLLLLGVVSGLISAFLFY